MKVQNSMLNCEYCILSVLALDLHINLKTLALSNKDLKKQNHQCIDNILSVNSVNHFTQQCHLEYVPNLQLVHLFLFIVITLFVKSLLLCAFFLIKSLTLLFTK